MWVAISPHLDDAVFGCGGLLSAHPGSVVVTVFAGLPSRPCGLTDWDRRCGFTSAEEAIHVRQREDAAALALIDARPVWLGFADSQYGDTPSVDAVSDALREVLRLHTPQTLLYPLGLFHSDHLLVHDASRRALADVGAGDALVYEDALYRGMRGLLQERLAALMRSHVSATPIHPLNPGDAALKARAVRSYASQLRAFGPGGWDDTAAPERYWRLSRHAVAEAADAT
jgi:LmbE family N-acetylglucosaminyl deacetylase